MLFLHLQERRGTYPQYEYISDTRVIFKTRLPLNEILVDFFDYLKSLSSGYARYVFVNELQDLHKEKTK